MKSAKKRLSSSNFLITEVRLFTSSLSFADTLCSSLRPIWISRKIHWNDRYLCFFHFSLFLKPWPTQWCHVHNSKTLAHIFWQYVNASPKVVFSFPDAFSHLFADFQWEYWLDQPQHLTLWFNYLVQQAFDHFQPWQISSLQHEHYCFSESPFIDHRALSKADHCE